MDEGFDFPSTNAAVGGSNVKKTAVDASSVASKSTNEKSAGESKQGAHAARALEKSMRGLVRVESIEEASQSQSQSGVKFPEEEEEAEENDHREGSEAQDASEERTNEIRDAAGNDMLFAPPRETKRRRLSSSTSPEQRQARSNAHGRSAVDHNSPAAAASLTASTTPTAPTPASARRFQSALRVSFAAATPSIQDDNLKPIRPAFRKPEPVNNDSATPLPDAFSPHRRGHKYVPGGLAETMRGWVIDVSQSLQFGQRRSGTGGQPTSTTQLEQFDGTLLKVTETRHGGNDFILAAGYCGHQTCTSLLVRKGKAGNQQEHVRNGDVVKLGRPSWDLAVAGEEQRWVVAVDWKLLGK